MTTKQLKNVILTIFLILLRTFNSLACSCEGKDNVANSIKYSNIVFSGQVISRSLTTNYDSLGIVVTGDTSKRYFNLPENQISVVKLKVDRIFKGKLVSDTLRILTPPNGASCGYRFQIGEKYIVYATIFDEMLGTSQLERRTFDNQTFWTHKCTRTQIWNTIEENKIIEETK